jgi:hypothetical protein
MRETDRYIYSSAPFNRTDVYVNLPYGGFYRPQGFAGTTPVEPQVPAYVAQPISAVLTAEAAYNAGNFVTENREDVVPGSGSLSVAPASGSESAGSAGMAPSAGTPAPANPAGLTGLTAFPADGPGTAAPLPSTTPAPVATPAPQATPTTLSPLPTPAPTPAASTTLPSLSNATAGGAGIAIIVDDSMPGAIRQDPPGSWSPSVNVADSYEGGSLIAKADGTARTVTFLADIPEDGRYEISMWYVISNQTMRSQSVPVTVQAAEGAQRVQVDQVNPALRRTFVPVGTFDLKAGQKVPVLTISTEGLPAEGTIYVSADAIRLVKVQ